MKCFIDYPQDHPFPIQNLPYGSFYFKGSPSSRRIGVAIGDYILDLQALSYTKQFPNCVFRDVFRGHTLNAFMSLDRHTWLNFRVQLQALLVVGSPINLETTVSPSNLSYQSDDTDIDGRRLFFDRRGADIVVCLPCEIGDYTDFYSSLEHAYNCGSLIRSPANALQPNWRHLPVAYHGRSSSIIPSDMPIIRPIGQILDAPGDTQPIIAPCRKLDFELEIGFFYGGASTGIGQRLSPAEAKEHVFGAVLLNDWSARDIQTWEYVPLGPFLSKNFATSISPWIIPIHALEEFAVPGYTHDPPLLPYLVDQENANFDIPLSVSIKASGSEAFTTISNSNLKHTYYTINQMISHHTTTGCPMRPGDLLGTGTLSAPGANGYGSLLEKSELGKKPFDLQSGTTRTFLEDGDTVKLEGKAQSKSGAYSIGFGECIGIIMPAVPL